MPSARNDNDAPSLSPISLLHTAQGRELQLRLRAVEVLIRVAAFSLENPDVTPEAKVAAFADLRRHIELAERLARDLAGGAAELPE